MLSLKRLRKNQLIRDLVAETSLSAKDLIMPYFVVEGKGVKKPIKSMPGVYHFSTDNLLKEIEQTKRLGINALLLFGIPAGKNMLGSQAYSKDGITQKAVMAIKARVKDMLVITDVCLCGYTFHGHCGIIKNQKHKPKPKNFEIDNDKTLNVLAKIAVSHAEAGADFVAPSAMADKQVRAIRERLDRDEFKDVGILAYSAKYASCFYRPFREALNSAPQFGDRKTYQMDFRNFNEALREIEQDIDEGADIIMVKPALTCLDIIYRAKEKFNVPVAAYSVSGEYAMVKAYSQNREAEKQLVLEILTAIKRAGANLIITYSAKDIAKWLKNY